MTVVAFPGVDLATIGEVPSPRGKVLYVQRHRGLFYLRIWPKGWVPTSFATAAQARAYAGALCESYPLIYECVVDEDPVDIAIARRGHGWHSLGWGYGSMSAAQAITKHFGGDWHGSYGAFPTPGHSKADRGMTVRDKAGRPRTAC